ncbi:squalene epoxidase-domain-containing protein [Halteromyces radiatus]|uniref:squalene epoxidase-domain-containing protein n=1 Tax=Halteromyces radiatus TaxID=101107 RepID=UPI00221FF523|nr:squalene epoxidase-domain-containing protein [Halteromyces radiatus]KAI8079955.1 squalene epoxidase-domain-containing protein [Halteromyces radiatus]
MTISETTYSEYDVIIVGAGILGSAAAKALGDTGRRVLLLERDLSEPDRIVGELLQPGGVNALHALGLEECLQGIDGIDCHGYGVIRDMQTVAIPYPINPVSNKEAVGKSFHHGRFVNQLRQHASAVENVTVKEATVTSLLKEQLVGEDDELVGNEKVVGVVAQIKDRSEEKFYAPLTIVADGLFSKFRKEMTTKTPDVRSYFVGFVMKDVPLPMPEHGHVILAKPSPILMYQISTHDTRILVDIPGQLPSASNGDLKRYLHDNIAPQLPDTIRTCFINALETERLRSMPNGFLPPSINNYEGMIVLGDAMNMRHPLTGGGMTVALNDVVLLRELLSPEVVPSFTDTQLVIKQMAKLHWKRKKYCTSINVLAMALYRLFAAEDEDLAVLQRGCFGYFKLGGNCIDGPCGLLSGLIQQPLVLVYHFFAVAIYAIYLEFKTGGWRQAPMNFIKIFTVLYTACVTIFPYLWSELQK